MAASRSAELPFNISKENIRKDLVDERPQWILSAYAPGKDAPQQLFGGYPREQSLEEVHLHYLKGVRKGDPQGALNDINALYQTAEQQIQSVLCDLDGAVKFVLDAQNRIPNRITICQQASASQPASYPVSFGGGGGGSTANPFSQPAQNALASTPAQPTSGAFGQTSVLGQRPNPFGTGAGAAAPPAFGQPAALGAAQIVFGQPAAVGAKPNPFGTAGRVFGQASATPPFGAAGGGGGAGAGGAFGGSAFGQPPTLVQQSDSPFGQAAAPAAQAGLFNQQPSGTSSFGGGHQQLQSQTVAPNGLGTSVAAPFGTSGSVVPPRAGAQQATSIPLASSNNNNNNNSPQQSAPTTGNGFSTQGGTTTSTTSYSQAPGTPRHQPSIESYTSRGPPTRLAPAGQLTMFKGRPVHYQPLGKDAHKPNAADLAQPMVRLPNGALAKVWFPDGAPPCIPGTELAGPQRERYNDDAVKAQWKPFLETGRFPPDGPMPDVPPLREWCLWNF